MGEGKGRKELLRRPNQRHPIESWVKTTDPETEETKAQEQGGYHKTVLAYKECFPYYRKIPQS